MDTSIAIQDTYPADFAQCYGCGRYNEHGHQIKTYLVDDETVTNHDPDPVHMAVGNLAYGGLIASLIDCHSTGSAAIFWMKERGLTIGSDATPRFVTGRLEVDYIAPTPLSPLRITGALVEAGERKVIVASELSSEGIVTARGRAVLVSIQI